MTEVLIYSAAAVLGLILAFMPWFIYAELKRQGKAREEEALKVITLLARIAGNVPDRAADEAARMQASLDMKSVGTGHNR